MKWTTDLPGLTLVRTYLFGSIALYRNEEKHTYLLRFDRARLAMVAGSVLFLGYALAVSAGYLWLREARKIDQVGIMDVAMFRVKKVRREMAVQQFAKAQAALAAKNYTEAFIEMSSGLHNDPDNVHGRLQLARFLELSGGTGRAVGLLEEGVTRTPNDKTLLEATFDLLITTGRADEALKLLHGELAPEFSGPNATLLKIDELLATLSTSGPAAARNLLDNYPELRKTTMALPAVAQVLWAMQDRLAAIETLTAFVRAEPDNMIGYVSLAGYQQTAGLIGEARQTADQACAHFPKEVAVRLVRIAVLEPTQPSEISKWIQEIGAFVKDFRDQPQALAGLAELSGQRGWVDPARLLYEAAVVRQDDFRTLAMYYSDALMFNHRFQEAQRVLNEIDRQTPEAAGQFSILLWQREIVAAAECGDHDDARENARRVASALRRDPDGLNTIRRRFVKMGIPEAVAELTITAPDLKTPAPKKS